MDLCDVEEIYEVIDAVADRAMFEEFTHLVEDSKMERDYTPSVTDASMTSASDSQSERTRGTTMDHSEVTSDAPSPASDHHDMMQETGANANNRHHPTRAGAKHSGLDLLIPVLIDKHKERTVVDRPATLPPSGGLVEKTFPVRLRASRPLAPRHGTQSATVMSWSHGSPPRTDVPQGRAGRSRTVRDPKKTAAVRKRKSCQHCAILRVECDENDLCARCGKWSSDNGLPDQHVRVCIRTRPDDILQSGRHPILEGGRWTPERSLQPASLNQRTTGQGQPVLITVYFSPSDWQGLQIPIGTNADGNFRIVGDCPVHETEILRWVESDLGKPCIGNFQRSVEAFLHRYAQRNCIEKHFARCQMSSAEEKAINDICDIIPNAFSNMKDPKETPAVWASLWALVLVYGQAIQLAAKNPLAFKNGFGEVTGRLLDALIVAMCGHFRTRNVLEALNRVCQPSFLENQDVMTAFEQARLERRIVYDQTQAKQYHGDDLIHGHLVQHERKVMGRKKQKGGKQSMAFEVVM
ncbi:hypothetical protein GE09DRAFT_1213203 [Coniochaeta sp. 2T2.1]|nr:hypothetical protein GE09DRAFT_1213203 [Coniochaeta sp. 2T2.1]